MNSNLFEPLVTIAGGVLAVAIIATLVSRNAQTPQVLGAAGSAFSNVISAATAPVTGRAATANVNGPSGGGFGSFPSFGGINVGIGLQP